MRTLTLLEPGSFQLTETPEPGQPGAGEALVRVHRVGICGTDLHAYRGRQPFFSYPRILGHELGVEVLALGLTADEPHVKVGDWCAVEPYLNCGVCSACRRGKSNCCRSLKVLGVQTDGGMRDLITVPISKLHPSQTLSLEHLALVETLCIGAHAVGRSELKRDEEVLVIGAGPIGLGAIQFARIAGANVHVLELNPARRDFCQTHLGIESFVPTEGNVAQNLEAMLNGELPTVVFDATGNVNSMHGAFQLVEHGGKLVFIGLVQAEITFQDPELHRREMTLLRSRNALPADFAWVIHHLEAGNVNLTPWITHHAQPDVLADTFPTWLNPENGVVKAMLDL